MIEDTIAMKETRMSKVRNLNDGMTKYTSNTRLEKTSEISDIQVNIEQ